MKIRQENQSQLCASPRHAGSTRRMPTWESAPDCNDFHEAGISPCPRLTSKALVTERARRA